MVHDDSVPGDTVEDQVARLRSELSEETNRANQAESERDLTLEKLETANERIAELEDKLQLARDKFDDIAYTCAEILRTTKS